MIIFRYDRTFEGLLCCVFDAYSRKQFPESLLGTDDPGPLFVDAKHTVVTDSGNADRVWKGISARVPAYIGSMIVYAWLSELPGSDLLLVRYIRKLIDSDGGSYRNFADPDILEVKNIGSKVSKEKHYLIQFVRFKKTSDDTFFAPVSPQYNALPLAVDHFKKRYGDQKWFIYDLKRKYGYAYDLKNVSEVVLEDGIIDSDGNLDRSLLSDNELLFQNLWKSYFKSISIKERKNPKLHRGHMPRRFWKYLTEKQDSSG